MQTKSVLGVTCEVKFGGRTEHEETSGWKEMSDSLAEMVIAELDACPS